MGQAKVRLPAVFLRVAASEVLDSEAAREAVSTAVSSGATAVVLSEDGAGGSALYDAACRLKVCHQIHSLRTGWPECAWSCCFPEPITW